MHVYPITTRVFIYDTEQLVYEFYRFLDIYAARLHVYRWLFYVQKIPKGSAQGRWKVQAGLAKLLGGTQPSSLE